MGSDPIYFVTLRERYLIGDRFSLGGSTPLSRVQTATSVLGHVLEEALGTQGPTTQKCPTQPARLLRKRLMQEGTIGCLALERGIPHPPIERMVCDQCVNRSTHMVSRT